VPRKPKPQRSGKALLPRIASVELTVEPAAPDLSITIDGKPFPVA
jgi:hypothetical protein